MHPDFWEEKRKDPAWAGRVKDFKEVGEVTRVTWAMLMGSDL